LLGHITWMLVGNTLEARIPIMHKNIIGVLSIGIVTYNYSCDLFT
jgi:hypothetical protein